MTLLTRLCCDLAVRSFDGLCAVVRVRGTRRGSLHFTEGSQSSTSSVVRYGRGDAGGSVGRRGPPSWRRPRRTSWVSLYCLDFRGDYSLLQRATPAVTARTTAILPDWEEGLKVLFQGSPSVTRTND